MYIPYQFWQFWCNFAAKTTATTEEQQNSAETNQQTAPAKKQPFPKRTTNIEKMWGFSGGFFSLWDLEGWDSPGWNLHICWKRPAIWTPATKSTVFFFASVSREWNLPVPTKKNQLFTTMHQKLKFQSSIWTSKKRWVLYNNSNLNGWKGVKTSEWRGFFGWLLVHWCHFYWVDISTAKNPGARHQPARTRKKLKRFWLLGISRFFLVFFLGGKRRVLLGMGKHEDWREGVREWVSEWVRDRENEWEWVRASASERGWVNVRMTVRVSANENDSEWE